MSTRTAPSLLLLDNYDSFTHNLAQAFSALGARVDVVRNDDARLSRAFTHDALCIGPGPGRPRDAGKTFHALARALDREIPVLGVCLGHQAIGAYFGARIDYAPRLMHGKTSEIAHDGSAPFDGIPSPFSATRYHSLCLARDAFPDALRVTAGSGDGVIQALAHRTARVVGVQFHPESVLTTEGPAILHNFLRMVTT